MEAPTINAVCGAVEVFEHDQGGEKRIIAQYMRPKDLELSFENVTTGPGMTNARFDRFPRLYRRGPQLITSGARPAAQDLALIPVFTDGELPLD